MNREIIGNDISRRRRAKLLTTDELARLACVPTEVVINIEEHRNGFTADQLMKVWLVLVPTIIE